MDKITRYDNTDGSKTYVFFCPGCKDLHPFDKRWTFNNNFQKPTFTPSLLCNQHDPETRCHSFVTDGRIQFLGDCHHELAGQTVDLHNVEDWWK